MNSTEVSTTLKDMWATRPVRPAHDRKVAGVGAALARRYDLDPVLVRVGLVAAAFTGVGLAFYVLAWAVLPGEPGAGRPRPVTAVLFAILAVVGVGALGNSRGGVVLPVVALAVLLFLLHRNRADRGLPGPGRPVTAAATGEPADAQHDGATPPAWDPLGAAPFAWDLPEPGPPAVPPPRRSRVTAITLALALLAAGVTGLVLLVAGGLTDLPVLLGVVLAVLGGGLVVGSFLRGGRGLVPVALLVGAVTWAVLSAPFDRVPDAAVGDLRLAPTTPAALAPRYDSGLGDVELDLRGMDLTVPPGAVAAPVATRIDSGVGDVEIRVPADADVRFTGTSGVGSVSFDDRSVDGPDARLSVDDPGADRVAGGRPIVLDVQSGAGDVEVRRG